MGVGVFRRAAIESIPIQGGNRERRHGLRTEMLWLGLDGGPGELTLERWRAERFAVLDQWFMIMSMSMVVFMAAFMVVLVLVLVPVFMDVIVSVPMVMMVMIMGVIVVVRLVAMVSVMFMFMVMIMTMERYMR